MFHKSDDLLSLANRMVTKVGIISSVIDKLADTLIPKTSARASGCPVPGYYFCGQSRCGGYCGYQDVGGIRHCYYTPIRTYYSDWGALSGCYGTPADCNLSCMAGGDCMLFTCTAPCSCPT